MFFSWAMNSVDPERAMNNNAMKITNFVIHGLFSMPLTDHEKQRPFFMMFSCVFHGFVFRLTSFHGA